MKRLTVFAQLLVLQLAVSALTGSLFAAEQPKQRPNILLISIDDLNDWVGCLAGHPQARTPHIDALAKRGTLFTNAHCQAPVCNPSRVSMLTGRYPHNTGVYFLSPDLWNADSVKEIPVLPQVFENAGYRTLAAGKIFHRGDQRFFQEYAGNFGGFGPLPEKKLSQPHGHPLWDWGAWPASDELMPDHQIANWAEARLNEEFEQPFFMGVGFYRPHVPMLVPQEWFDLHPRSAIQLPEVLDSDRDDLGTYAIDLTNREHVAPDHQWVANSGQWPHAVQSYLASTSFVDHCVGRVLHALDNSPYASNTIVVLFSDHGFHLGEKQRWAKRSLWEDATRVPLIIAAPAQVQDVRCEHPVELLDVFPTLLELAGLQADPAQHGQSLVPLLKPNVAEWPHPAITSFGPGNLAIRTKRFRYIRYRDGSEELYDHEQDPHEWTNLANQPASSETLQGFRKQVPNQFAPLLPGDSTGHKAFSAANQSAGLDQ